MTGHGGAPFVLSQRYLLFFTAVCNTKYKVQIQTVFVLQLVIQKYFLNFAPSNQFLIVMATKVISVRVEERVLRELDDAVKSLKWYNRNNIVEGAILLATYMIKEKNMGKKLACFDPYWGDVVDKLEFEYHRDHELREKLLRAMK